MQTFPIVDWLASRFGLDPTLIVAVFPPIFVFGLAVLLHAIFVRVVYRRVESPERRALWRRVSFDLTFVGSIATLAAYWRLRGVDWLMTREAISLESRFHEYLVAAIDAAIATAVLLYAVSRLFALHRFARGRLDDWADSLGSIRLQDAEVVSKGQMVRTAGAFLDVTRIAAVVGAFYLYVPLVLTFLPLTRPYADQVMPYVLHPVIVILGAVIGYLPRLLTLALILLGTRLVLGLLRKLTSAVRSGELRVSGFDREWAEPTYRLARIVLVLFTVVIAYPFLPGAGSDIFKGFSVFIGAVLTLGSTAAINNVISGIVLTYTRSFRVGDRVELGGTLGDVVEKGLFVTRIRAIEGEVVTVPNGKVLASDVINLTQAADTQGLAVGVTAGIGYDADWRQVHELMVEAARATQGVEAEPAPFVLQTALGNYAVDYLLVATTREPTRKRFIESELRQSVLDVFHREGIEIMTPTVASLRDGNQPAIPASSQPAPLDLPGLELLAGLRGRT